MSDIACRQCGKIFQACAGAFNGPYCTCPLPAPTFTTDSAMTPPDTKTPTQAQLREYWEAALPENLSRSGRSQIAVQVATMQFNLTAATQRIAELEAHADRMAEALEWRDIDSAPRDGSEILGYREDCGAVLMRWAAPCDFLNERELEGVKDADEPDWFCADFICGAYRISNDGQPTHWLPIPQFAAYRAANETKLP